MEFALFWLFIPLVGAVSLANKAGRVFNPECRHVRSSWVLLWGLTAALAVALLYRQSLIDQRDRYFQAPENSSLIDRWD